MTSDHEGAAPSHSSGTAVHEIGVLRRQARELWQVVRSGEPGALERVLRSHPKYSGRPPDRLQPGVVKLRDAQEVVALENGWAGWAEVVETTGDFERAFARALKKRGIRLLHLRTDVEQISNQTTISQLRRRG